MNEVSDGNNSTKDYYRRPPLPTTNSAWRWGRGGEPAKAARGEIAAHFLEDLRFSTTDLYFLVEGRSRTTRKLNTKGKKKKLFALDELLRNSELYRFCWFATLGEREIKKREEGTGDVILFLLIPWRPSRRVISKMSRAPARRSVSHSTWTTTSGGR